MKSVVIPLLKTSFGIRSQVQTRDFLLGKRLGAAQIPGSTLA
ncbi:MAG TPA: hypothetical protein VK961_21110 [Chthoniobacter sp.]|nr:hypothetical protein [Chthoniobacter sp.]